MEESKVLYEFMKAFFREDCLAEIPMRSFSCTFSYGNGLPVYCFQTPNISDLPKIEDRLGIKKRSWRNKPFYAFLAEVNDLPISSAANPRSVEFAKHPLANKTSSYTGESAEVSCELLHLLMFLLVSVEFTLSSIHPCVDILTIFLFELICTLSFIIVVLLFIKRVLNYIRDNCLVTVCVNCSKISPKVKDKHWKWCCGGWTIFWKLWKRVHLTLTLNTILKKPALVPLNDFGRPELQKCWKHTASTTVIASARVLGGVIQVSRGV